MIQAAKYILLAFLALLLIALIGYTDCRVHGDNPDKCRLVFKSLRDLIFKIEEDTAGKEKTATPMICSPTLICSQPKDKK